jgi:hypothetical protein
MNKKMPEKPEKIKKTGKSGISKQNCRLNIQIAKFKMFENQ